MKKLGNKKLELTVQTIRELDGDQLRRVAGGSGAIAVSSNVAPASSVSARAPSDTGINVDLPTYLYG